MSDPLAKLYTTQSPTGSTKSEVDPLAGLYGSSTPKQEDQDGWLPYLGKLALHFAAVQNVKGKMQNPLFMLTGGYNPDPNSEEGKIKSAIETGQHQSFNDLIGGFKQMWDNTSTTIKDGVSHPQEIWNGIKSGISLAAIGKGLLQPAVDAYELDSDVSLTGDDVHTLSPVEKATRVRDLVAFGAASAVGGGVSGIFEKTLGKAALEGSLALRMARGVSSGAGGMGTYSAVNQQSGDQIISSMLLGGGLGILGAGKGESIKGPDVAKVREMQPETNSIASQVGVINATLSNDDMASVILSGKVPLQPNIPWKIPGLDLDKLNQITSKVPDGFKDVVHVGADGKGKLLVYNPEQFTGNINESFFRRTGYLKDEQVSYQGKDNWSIQDAVGNDVTIRNESDGNIIDVPKSDIVESIQTQTHSLDDATLNNLYNEWQSTLPKSKGYSESGLPTPESIGERIPEIEGLELKSHLNGFLSTKGFVNNQFEVLRRQLQGKIKEEANARMAPADRDFISANRPSSVGSSEIVTHDNLKNAASSTRLKLKVNDGKYILSDNQGNSIKSFDAFKDAKDFINQSGKAEGPKLDDNQQFDTGSASGSPPIPPDAGGPVYPEDEPTNHIFGNNQLGKSNWGENLWNFIPGLKDVSWATPTDAYLRNFDRKFNTGLSPLFNKLWQLRNQSAAMTKDDIIHLKSIQKGLASKPESFQKIDGYIKTASPLELRGRFTPEEIARGQVISESGVHPERVIEFERAASKLKSSDKMYQQQMQGLMKQFGINTRELAIKRMFDDIRALPNEQVSLGNVLRYARALDDGTGRAGLSKMEYIRANNMSAKEVSAAQQLMMHMDQLKKSASVKSNIYDVLSHADIYERGNIVKAAQAFELPDENLRDFTKASAFNASNGNPFKTQLKAIQGVGHINSGFFDAYNSDMYKELDKWTSKADEGDDESVQAKYPANMQKARSVFTRAISDLRGLPSNSDQALQENTQIALEKFGMKDGKLIQNVSRTVGRTINFKFLDFRPQLGISHFGLSYLLGFVGRDIGYANRALANGFGKWDITPEVERLQNRGVFRAVAPYSAFTPDADITSYGSRIGEVVDKVEDAGFKATLLPSVYDRWAVGHYLTTEHDVLSGLKDYADKKLTQQGLIDKLYLTRYDVPVIKEFNRLAESGQPADAAHYLASQAVHDLVGVYGKGNTPYGWGNAWGSLLTQYGQFSRFKWAAIIRLVTRGTMNERMASAAKLAAIHYGFSKLSDATGVNWMKLDPLYDMFWIKSAAVGEAEDIATAMHGVGLEQTLAQHRLEKQVALGFAPIPNVMIDMGNAFSDISQGNVGTGAAELLGFRRQPRR